MISEITLPSPNVAQHPSARHTLLYFFTGNPGYISYYVPFFTRLRSLLNDIEAKHSHKALFTIAGRNYIGFDDADHSPPFNTTTHKPFNVEAEIQYSFKHLLAANAIPSPAARQGEPFDDVVLMGHSLGTYIALEIFHRHLHERSIAPGLNLKSGILLFATISHLAKSPKGVNFNLLRRTPVLGTYIPLIARAGLSLLPTAAIRWVVSRVIGMPPHATEVTTNFLTSRDGVYQALYLGFDEMAVISEESWAEELWEIADEAVAHKHEVPKFFILFGGQDHWVSNEHRDRFIETREEHVKREGVPGHKRGRTRIEVDETGLPHDFCISHSETVAEKVAVWVDEIAEHL
ncbi:hypothetical protein N0V93_006158 [Gnomoniopsis smithogilvyi]|uniref:Lipid droplet-associated hydrolase n=1 Tax=Gnomoniopsis smithogilvyi TaxID=1191159 RepID=A0A9W9CUG8_9PEZI|nr:hypothetical protein N0V93_006158 [Gnomoniopsis smithogilvyi]